MKGWQVKEVAHDLVWHIRLAAMAFEHCVDSYGGVVALDPDAPEDVRKERAKAVNLISDMGTELIGIGQLLRCEVDGSFQGAASALIKKCDLAMADLKVNALQEHLKEQAREEKRRKENPPEDKPEDHES